MGLKWMAWEPFSQQNSNEEITWKTVTVRKLQSNVSKQKMSSKLCKHIQMRTHARTHTNDFVPFFAELICKV